MGVIIEINDHLDVEIRRESFVIHDEELCAPYRADVAPEFGFERVFPMKALIEEVLKHPRFVEWLRKKEIV